MTALLSPLRSDRIPPSSGRRSKPTRPHLTWASPATPSSRTRLSRGLGISSGLVFNAPFGGQPACNCRSRPRPPLFLDVVQSCQYADRLAPPQSRLDGPAILQEDRGGKPASSPHVLNVARSPCKVIGRPLLGSPTQRLRQRLSTWLPDRIIIRMLIVV